MTDVQHDLAVLVHRLRRTVPGAHDWDVPGIEHFIGECEGASPCEVAAAAFALAARPELKTPALLPKPGPHWPKGDGMTGPRVRMTQDCPEHKGYDQPCQHADHHGEMTPEQIAEAKAYVLSLAKPYAPRLPGRVPPPGQRSHDDHRI